VDPIEVDDPLQIVFAEPATAAGKGFTVTVTELDLLHPVAVIVSVTVYVVVLVGLALGLDIVELLNPVDGVHE